MRYALFLVLLFLFLIPSGLADEYQSYAPVKLTADLSHLSEAQREMLRELIEAARIMDGLFWRQANGDQAALMSSLEDPQARAYARIN